jgi:hypothetical protein
MLTKLRCISQGIGSKKEKSDEKTRLCFVPGTFWIVGLDYGASAAVSSSPDAR